MKPFHKSGRFRQSIPKSRKQVINNPDAGKEHRAFGWASILLECDLR
jgi:hypothetical protein